MKRIMKTAIKSTTKTINQSNNYDYFVKTDTSRYQGEWIAIAGEKVVCHGKDAEKVYKIAKKKVKNKDVSLAKVPEEQMMVF